MICNLNARKLSDDSIFVQWEAGGKRYDGSFSTWLAFAEWLRGKVGVGF